ncbi:hypothetical protein Tco_0884187 [Tanacetum coccineum]
MAVKAKGPGIFLSDAPDGECRRRVHSNAQVPTRVEYTYALRLTYCQYHNAAEYEAHLAGLDALQIKMKVSSIEEIHMGSCGNEHRPKSRGIMKACGKAITCHNCKPDAKEDVYINVDSCQIMSTDIQASPRQNTFIPSMAPSEKYGPFINGDGHPGTIDTTSRWRSQEEFNEEEQRLNLDLLQERREAAAIREARYKSKMEQYYNKKVRPAGFRPGEFVYRRNEASRVEDQGKLGPKWEGPYRVTEAFENGSYKLQTMEDKIVPRTWHAINLRKCYL